MTTSGIIRSGREYVRVSVDRSGRERSPEEQHSDNARAADTRGWTLAEPAYRDIGSASRFAKKSRQGFDKLIADLENDTFNADVLILWESSRGSRLVEEWAKLIRLCELRAAKIYITSDSKLYDPADGRDRRSLIDDANDAEYEAAKTSKRTRRTTAAQAVAGGPHGGVPFGYRRIYDSVSGNLDKQIPHPDEAKVIKELFKQLHRGVSLRAVASDFEQRGFRSRSGKVFHPAHLRTLALSHVYAGLRVHDPKRKGHKLSPDAVFTEGQWPALVSRSRFLAVQSRLTSPARKTTRPGRGVHLLSHLTGAVVCDACSGTLAARPGRANYSCADGGHVTVGYEALNDLVEEVILSYLERADNAGLLSAADADDDVIRSLRDDIAGLRKERDDLADAVGRGDLSAALAARAEPAIVARLRAAEAREMELSTPSVLASMFATGKPIRQAWRDAPMSAKRTAARIVLAPNVLGELRIKRSPVKRHQVPVHERIVWRRES